MSSTATTPFSSQCLILGELWLNYRQDDEFTDFVEYNDLGLPLAYAIAESVIEASPTATRFVGETWDLLLESLGLEDTGFTTLDEMLDY